MSEIQKKDTHFVIRTGVGELLRAAVAYGADEEVVRSVLFEGNQGDPKTQFILRRVNPSCANDTDLALAALVGCEALVQKLLAEGDNPDSTGEEGKTALMYAVQMGHENIARELLKAGANINAVDQKGWSALMYALFYRRCELAWLLLSAGADVTIRAADGATPLMLAPQCNDTQLVLALLERGADVKAEGGGSLLEAAARRSPDVIRFLLQRGVHADVRGHRGGTPLILATTDTDAEEPGDWECVGLLLGAGADVNVADDDGWTPLMGGALYGDVRVVRALLSAGAQVDARDKKRRTPLALARQAGHSDIVAILEAADAKE